MVQPSRKDFDQKEEEFFTVGVRGDKGGTTTGKIGASTKTARQTPRAGLAPGDARGVMTTGQKPPCCCGTFLGTLGSMFP